jgi:hypothetical protein
MIEPFFYCLSMVDIFLILAKGTALVRIRSLDTLPSTFFDDRVRIGVLWTQGLKVFSSCFADFTLVVCGWGSVVGWIHVSGADLKVMA